MMQSVLPASANEVTLAYQRQLYKRVIILVTLIVLIVTTLLVDFTLGPSGLSLSGLFQALIHPNEVDATTQVIVWELRLPYALIAVAVGLSLGLAGAEIQTILNNPLASPFTLGISSAAAFGAAMAIVLNISIPGISPTWIISSNAFLFAVLSAVMLDAVTRWGGMPASGVVLFGIALVFSFNALLSLLQFVASADALQGVVFWTMGSLTQATWVKVGILFALFVVLLPFAMANAWKMTAFRLGEERAASFGVSVKRLRLGVLIRVSLLSATAVAFVGTIGFIGLVAPHIARRFVGEDHRFYLPASALIGGAILSMASVASKNIIPGVIIPVGIVTALVGIPFFLLIVFSMRGQGR
ncbi:FecCD family ABC transporter permease [Undibacterium sp. Di27W]|uniref:FecCD family ABC transporter permease n=1 Tax=Undibacterium sp. Di27W TaxID=3413036 RepID=UPI003BF3943A